MVVSGISAEADGFLREPGGNSLVLGKPLRAAARRSAVAFLLDDPGLRDGGGLPHTRIRGSRG